MIIVLRAGTPEDGTVQQCHSARKPNELPLLHLGRGLINLTRSHSRIEASWTNAR
jgi:hypothetical protein